MDLSDPCYKNSFGLVLAARQTDGAATFCAFPVSRTTFDLFCISLFFFQKDLLIEDVSPNLSPNL